MGNGIAAIFVWIATGNISLYKLFISSIPVALDEAAAIDGATNLQIFFRIILPQLKSVTITVIILQGVSVWNEYTYSLFPSENRNAHDYACNKNILFLQFQMIMELLQQPQLSEWHR